MAGLERFLRHALGHEDVWFCRRIEIARHWRARTPMKPSALTRDDFVDRFGPVYEASPWVAEAVWPAVARGALDEPEALAQAMRAAVDDADQQRSSP